MPTEICSRDRILQAVLHRPGRVMEDLLLDCPGLTWNQIFFEIDRLSREGRVRLAMEGPARYVVTPAEPDTRDVAA